MASGLLPLSGRIIIYNAANTYISQIQTSEYQGPIAVPASKMINEFNTAGLPVKQTNSSFNGIGYDVDDSSRVIYNQTIFLPAECYTLMPETVWNL